MHLRFRQEVEHLKQQRAEAAGNFTALQEASDSEWDDLNAGLENS
ncbi:MAG: hypothetical protein RBR06_02610 [Desulfuromonadaceae bacterium]|nr:hypothetical protein [Desulfuromonadaceae bacterium]